ncbi:unnamed protein product [Cunninghamella blakesleeana]
MSTTSWQTCTSLTINMPLYPNLSLDNIHSFQFKTASFLYINDNSDNVSMELLTRSLPFFLHLNKLCINSLLNTSSIASVVSYIVKFQSNITLIVSPSKFLAYHHKLSLQRHNIILQEINSNNVGSTINNNDDHSDFYNTPEFVKVRVLEYKRLLKLPFLQSGLLSHNIFNDEYTYDTLWINNEQLTEVINNYAKKLIRCIFLGTKHWILITQFDVFYMNNMQYDDCARTFNGSFPSIPSPKVVTKNEYNNSWKEIVLQWDPLQFLALGGYIGNTSNINITPFLGSAVKEIQLEDDTFDILTSFFDIPFQSRPRYLRDYSKKHSHLHWSFISISDLSREFIACHPLYIDCHPSRKNCKPNFLSLYSFILRLLCHLSLSKNDLSVIQRTLLDTPTFMKNININDLPTTSSTFFNDIFNLINNFHEKKLSLFIPPLNIIKTWESKLNENATNNIIIIPTTDLKKRLWNFIKNIYIEI